MKRSKLIGCILLFTSVLCYDPHEEFQTREEHLEEKMKEKEQDIERHRKEVSAQEEELEEKEREYRSAETSTRRQELEKEIHHIEREKSLNEESIEADEETQEEIREQIENIKEGLEDAFSGRDDDNPEEEDEIDKCEKKFMNEHVVLNVSNSDSLKAKDAYRKALDDLLRYEYIKFSNARDISPSRWERIEAATLQAKPGDAAYDPDFKRLLQNFQRAKSELEKYTEYAIPPKNDAAEACRNSLIEMVENLLKDDKNDTSTHKGGIFTPKVTD